MSERPRVTIPSLGEMKRQGRKIAMLTAYDYSLARLLDEAGIDIVLVGDSLGMVVLGYDSTTPVTMEQMLHHCRAVRRGVTRALLVGDIPFAGFHADAQQTVEHAARFLHEAGCDAVKVEWRDDIVQTVTAMTAAGIPVMGHVGLTPQTAAGEGGFKVRGKDADSAARIIEQAAVLQRAGCFAMVLECIPDVVAQAITRRLTIPTIGIGAGKGCDGQVLVTYDLLGLFTTFRPKFVKAYAELASTVRDAVGAYAQEVRTGAFPGREHTFTMPAEEQARLDERLR